MEHRELRARMALLGPRVTPGTRGRKDIRGYRENRGQLARLVPMEMMAHPERRASRVSRESKASRGSKGFKAQRAPTALQITSFKSRP
jgi:hypothetical protein